MAKLLTSFQSSAENYMTSLSYSWFSLFICVVLVDLTLWFRFKFSLFEYQNKCSDHPYRRNWNMAIVFIKHLKKRLFIITGFG